MPPRSRLENIELALKRSHSLPDYRPSVVTTAAKIRNDARLADIESALHPAKALNAVMAGRSICIHGSANSALNIIRGLQTKYRESPDSLVITSTKESNIGAIPLHEFVGLFPTNTDPALVFAATKQIPVMDERWQKARTIVIENVHLLDGRHLDIIDHAARFIKYNLLEPFGGLQLVLIGDFVHPFAHEPDHVFAFDAKAWLTETYSLQD